MAGKPSENIAPPICDASLYRRLIARPIARKLAPILCTLGFSADGVCWLKLLFGLVGAVLLMSRSPGFCLVGMLLMQISLWLDAADGDVARWRGTAGRLSGEYIDKLFDHLPKTTMYFFWGYGAFRLTGGQFPLFCGVFLAAWNIYPRFCLVETLLERLDKAPGVIHLPHFSRAVGASFVTQATRGKTDYTLTIFFHPAANLLAIFFLLELLLPEIKLFDHVFSVRLMLLAIFTFVSAANFLRKGIRHFRALDFSYVEKPPENKA
jgi:phosphatidylglycerophosphate synthase